MADEKKYLEVKDVADIVGKYGLWQRLHFYVLFYMGIPSAFVNMYLPFIAPKIEFWCATNGTDFLYNQTEENSCIIHDPISNATQLCDNWEYDNSFYTATIISDWDLVCGDSWLVSFHQAMYFIGYLIGVFIFGQLSDSYGRKPAFVSSIILATIFNFASAFSNSYIMFLITRFFLALNRAGAFIVFYVVVMELGNQRYREVASLFSKLGWASGCIILPGAAWLLRDWRHLTYLSAFLTLPLVGLFLLSESPRWLLSKGKEKEGQEVIASILKRNSKKVPDLEIKMKMLSKHILQDQDAKANKKTIIDVFKSTKYRKYSLVLFVNWIACALLTYGLSLNIHLLGNNIYINSIITATMEIPAGLIVFFCVRHIGRKPILATSMFAAGIACALIFTVPEDSQWLKLVLAAISKLFIAMSFYLLYLYTPEIYPTVVRNVGIGSCSMVARIGSILAPFLRELAVVSHPSVPLALIGGFAVVAGTLLFMLPETYKKTLPDILE